MTKTPRKRRLDEDGEEAKGDAEGSIGGKFKRPKRSTRLITSTPVANLVPKFQNFHLGILQSLYKSNANDDEGADLFASQSSSSDEEGGEDEGVEDAVWSHARRFLKEREKLRERKEEASHMENIHREALRFTEEKDILPKSPPARSMAAGSSWYYPAEKCAFPMPVSPQQSLSMFSPLRSTGPSQQISDGRPALKCFTLVSNLLEKRFRNTLFNSKRLSDPHNSLLDTVNQKISKLKVTLKKRRESKLSDRRAAVEDLLARPVLLSSSQGTMLNDPLSLHNSNKTFGNHSGNCGDSGLEKLEAKLELWTMLASDLRDII